MDLTKIKNTIKVKSPDILLGAGIVGIVVGTIAACKATKKTTEIIKEHNEKLNVIHSDMVDENEKPKEITKTYVSTGLKLTKLYLPSGLILAGSIGCLVGGHVILNKRNLGLAAAYTALDTCYKDYRQQVIDKYGEEVDRQFQYGVKPMKQKDGEEKLYKASDKTFNLNDPTVLLFDETNPDALSNNKYNKDYLFNRKKLLNDRLLHRKWISLNEAKELHGCDLSKLSKDELAIGQIKGWVLRDDLLNVDPDSGEITCTQIDTGFEKDIHFMKEEEKYTILHFNCDSLLTDIDIMTKNPF